MDNIQKAELILNKETGSFTQGDNTDFSRLYVKIGQDWIKAKKEFEIEKRRLKMLKEVEILSICNTPIEGSVTDRKPEGKLHSKTLAETMVDIQYDKEDTDLLKLSLESDMLHTFWKSMEKMCPAISGEVKMNFKEAELAPLSKPPF